MFKKIIGLSLLILTLASCGNSETSQLAIGLPSNQVFLIPADTPSCVSIRTSVGAPTKDITKSYFKLPGVKLGWNDAGSTLFITLFRITFKDSKGTEMSCDVAGTDLQASLTTWYQAPLEDPKIAANTTATLDCPITCGGLTSDGQFVGTAKVKVFGFSQNNSTGDQTPVQSQGTFQIGSPF